MSECKADAVGPANVAQQLGRTIGSITNFGRKKESLPTRHTLAIKLELLAGIFGNIGSIDEFQRRSI